MNESSVTISDIELTSPIQDPTYVYAMATMEQYDKKTAVDLMTQFRDSKLVGFSELNASSPTTMSFTLDQVLDVNKIDTISIDMVDRVYVYLHARYDSGAFAYGMANEYHKVTASYLTNTPRVVMSMSDVTDGRIMVDDQLRLPALIEYQDRFVEGVIANNTTDGQFQSERCVVDSLVSADNQNETWNLTLLWITCSDILGSGSSYSDTPYNTYIIIEEQAIVVAKSVFESYLVKMNITL